MAGAQPLKFIIGVEDFDLKLLPPDAQQVGSDAFRSAVRQFYRDEFAAVGGTVSVAFDRATIEVTWEPDRPDTSLFERAAERLRVGDRAGAVPLLQALVAVEPDNVEAHYNLGMALSDLGSFSDAQLHLLKVVHRDPENVNALVALGVALSRSGDLDAARRRLEQAIAQDPSNGYAHRNLAAVFGNLGERAAAIRHFREAYRLLPDDQLSIYGLARALDDFGDDKAQAEAGRLYRSAIALDPDTEIAELARRASSSLAQRRLKSAADGLRMDAVMYCLGALERFAQMRREDVQAVAFEVALLGRRGIDVNDPETTYELRSLPGEFTGLHLMSLMYVGFKQVAPEMDIGFDLAAEHEAALQLIEERPNQPA